MTPTTYYTIVESPIEPLLLTSDGTCLTGLYMSVQKHEPENRVHWVRADELPVLREAAAQLYAYFAGELREFSVPLQMHGTEFQRLVWDELKRIPFGTTISYGELARRIGRPQASRAVGLANGRNPISIIVPCHRVIGSSGALVGYGGGLTRKVTLLDLEKQFASQQLSLTAAHCSEPSQ